MSGPVDEDFTQGGLQFENKVTGGNIPKEFIPSVQKGLDNAILKIVSWVVSQWIA